MIYNLVIDADSILYTSCSRSQLTNNVSKGLQYTDEERKESFNLEKAYIEFMYQIKQIESEHYKHIEDESGDFKVEIVFSPKITFRHLLTKDYKANRKPSNIFGMGDLQNLLFSRLCDTDYTVTKVEKLEADDIVITRAYEKENVVIACIDKDIYTHSPVDCFNYKKWIWSDGLDQETIETNYWIQALMGDSSDGIKGAKGVGIKTAEALVYAFAWNGYETFVKQFNNEEEAKLSMRLVRMDQYSTENGITLWNN